MDIKLCATTFDVNDILRITQSLFITALNENKLTLPHTRPELFSFYDDYISSYIDEIREGVNLDRGDFYEAISMMSWALYRGWAKKVVDENYPLECFDVISKEYLIRKMLQPTQKISFLKSESAY